MKQCHLKQQGKTRMHGHSSAMWPKDIDMYSEPIALEVEQRRDEERAAWEAARTANMVVHVENFRPVTERGMSLLSDPALLQKIEAAETREATS